MQLFLVIALLCLVLSVCLVADARRRGLVYVGLTKGGLTLVHDDSWVLKERIRVLEVAGTYQSATFVDERWADPVFPYHVLFDHVFDAWGDSLQPRRIAVLGGGGYALPKSLIAHHSEVSRVDVVEIDPAIERIAQRFFYLDRLEERYQALSTERLRLHVADAQEWLRSTPTRYDAIMNDCFLALEPEASLMTPEGAHLIAQHLEPGGIYLTNVVSALVGPDAHTLEQTARALTMVFGHVWVYPCAPDAPHDKDNNVLIASSVAHHFDGAWTWPLMPPQADDQELS